MRIKTIAAFLGCTMWFGTASLASEMQENSVQEFELESVEELEESYPELLNSAPGYPTSELSPIWPLFILEGEMRIVWYWGRNNYCAAWHNGNKYEKANQTYDQCTAEMTRQVCADNGGTPIISVPRYTVDGPDYGITVVTTVCKDIHGAILQ